jgi:hypothetical protein
VGGIVGKLEEGILSGDLTNEGAVTTLKSGIVGGIAGSLSFSADAIIANGATLENKADITGLGSVGGIFGLYMSIAPNRVFSGGATKPAAPAIWIKNSGEIKYPATGTAGSCSCCVIGYLIR